MENTSTQPVYIYSVTLTTTSGITFAVYGMNPPAGTPIAPGATVSFSVWANSNDSGNLVFDATATITWGHNYPGPDPDNHLAITRSWRINGTPTLQSAGYGACQNPGYVGL